MVKNCDIIVHGGDCTHKNLALSLWPFCKSEVEDAESVKAPSYIIADHSFSRTPSTQWGTLLPIHCKSCSYLLANPLRPCILCFAFKRMQQHLHENFWPITQHVSQSSVEILTGAQCREMEAHASLQTMIKDDTIFVTDLHQWELILALWKKYVGAINAWMVEGRLVPISTGPWVRGRVHPAKVNSSS